MRPFQAPGTLCVVCLLGTVGWSQVAPAAEVRDTWVEVRINQVPQPAFALVHVDLRGHLYARVADLLAWHMRPPASAGPDDQVRIDDIPGLQAYLLADDTVLRLEADPALFSAQVVDNTRQPGAPDPGVPAVFMGYNLFGERDGGAGDTYSALLQAGSSYGRASLTSTWLGSHIVAAQSAAAQVIGDEQTGRPVLGWHRLDTALLLDFPEYTARLTVGDSITALGTLGDAVRFTGVHWATDYATRPGLTPYALPVVSGTATMPSTVELYINNALVQRTNVDAGPFQLNNVPVPVGQGAVDIRMRDLMGQEQQLSVPYLVTPQLIAAGLTTCDLAAGAVREDYGLQSFSYGAGFLSAGLLHGSSSSTTLSAAAELLQSQLTVRAGAAWRATRNITVELTPAVSHSAGQGAGGGVDAGFDASWPSTTFAVHLTDASSRYVELGNLAAGERLHTQWAAQASTQVGRAGSVALLYAWRRSYDAPTTQAATLSYNLSLRRFGSLSVFVSDTRSAGGTDVTGGIVFTRYLGRGVTASVTGTSEDGSSTAELQVGRPAPPDSGWGWALAHARGEINTDGLRVEGRTAYGIGSGEVDATSQGTLGILSWQGGLLWAGGRTWPAQTLSGPAALLVVPDLGGVAVLHDGQPVGRTDDSGRIIVPSLRPFEDNTLTIVPEDMPLTAMVDTDKVTVRPYSHGVVSVTLAVAAIESRVFALRLTPEVFVPPGAAVSLGGHAFPVGTQGIAQLPVGRAAAAAIVTWPGGRCRIHLPDLAAAGLAGSEPLVVDCKGM